MLKQAIIIVPPLLLAFACAKTSDDSPSRTVPEGKYQISNPVCVSSSESPEYPDFQYAVAVHDFSNLTVHTLTLQGSDITEVFEDSDCKMILTGKSATNYSGYFSRTQQRSYLFEPEGCTLSITVDEMVSETGAAYSTFFDGSAEKSEDIIFAVERDGDVYTLKSADQEPIRSVWKNYGCEIPDQLRSVWIKF